MKPTSTAKMPKRQAEYWFYLCLSVFICGSTALAKPPVVPETAPLEITVPNFHVKTLSCGLKVLFLKDTHLPLVSANFMAPGGIVTDPVGKEGLVGLMSNLLRSGGAGLLAPEAFDAALENKAISMGASADNEDFGADFKCLAADLPEVLGLFADMLRRPQFDAKRLETAKANSMDSLKRLEDTPDTLTRVLFYRALMGHSPYGRWASPKSVGGITREDVVQFYQKNFGPEGAVLALAGNFDEDKTFAQLEKLFDGWKTASPQVFTQDAKPLGPTVYFFPKEVTQVFIRFGVLGIKRHDPRDIPLQVANYILGGSGFTSRMMQEIRSDRGLAYFVYSYSLPFNVRGPYQILGGTRPDSVKEYLSLMFQLMRDFAKNGPTNGELADAKKSMIEEFAYNFESPYTLASYKASLDFNGYPDDYLQTYRSKVKAVTKEDATEAARSILDQENWVLVVCGPEELEPVLESFGKVRRVTGIFDSLGK